MFSQTDRQTETRRNRLKIYLKKKLNIIYQTEMDKTNRKRQKWKKGQKRTELVRSLNTSRDLGVKLFLPNDFLKFGC